MLYYKKYISARLSLQHRQTQIEKFARRAIDVLSEMSLISRCGEKISQQHMPYNY